MTQLHQHQIYAIARIVVFEDPILAEARPDWAIHDSATGGLWRTWNGLAWVNAHRSEVWDYNIAIAKEAAALGFDEIQLDYIRFPTDGDLSTAEYGVPHNDETRPQAIASFLQQMYTAIAPTHAYLAADVFGLTVWATDDGQIGQNLETMIKYLDYICPMIYPSHFAAGSMGFDIPNDHPYEVILWSLQNGEERIPEQKAKLRPWLQDFSLGEGNRVRTARSEASGRRNARRRSKRLDALERGERLSNDGTRTELEGTPGNDSGGGSDMIGLETKRWRARTMYGSARALLETMRPKQWTKNAVVFAPLVFDNKLFNLNNLVLVAYRGVLFCITSGVGLSLQRSARR